MSEIKAKSKDKKNYNDHRITSYDADKIKIDLQGFLCSCNNREKECLRETYKILNRHDQNENRFEVVNSGTKDFFFIRTTLGSPVQLVETIIKDTIASKRQKTKYLLRLIPVEVTCRAEMKAIEKAFTALAVKYFAAAPRTFAVVYNHRKSFKLDRSKIVKMLADKVTQTRSDHKVDLKAAELSVICEIIKGFAFLSVVPNYRKYKKYNLLSIFAATW